MYMSISIFIFILGPILIFSAGSIFRSDANFHLLAPCVKSNIRSARGFMIKKSGLSTGGVARGMY